MKLISEYTSNDIQTIVEKDENENKKYVINGIFAQANAKNKNGRIYPKEVMEKSVKRYNDIYVSKNRAVGELDHPHGPNINLDKVSHKIESLVFEGNNVIGKATILDTPMGKIVKGFIDGGVQLGVSTRGMGTLYTRSDNVVIVKDDFILSAVDIVQDPSAPSAFVNGIMEGKEWIWNNGNIEEKRINEIKKRIMKAPKRDLNKVKLTEFRNFMSTF